MGIGLPWLGPVALLVGCAGCPRDPFGLAGTLLGWGGLWIALLLLRADAAVRARPRATDPTSRPGSPASSTP